MAKSEQEDDALMKELLKQCPIVDDLTCSFLIMNILVAFINRVDDLKDHMTPQDVLAISLTQNYLSARKRGVLDPKLAVEIAIRQMKDVLKSKEKSNE